MAAALILAATAGLLIGLVGTLVLRRLPEPVPPADADEQTRREYLTKISYRSLATGRFAVVCGLLAAVAAVVAVTTRPAAYWPAWMVFGTVAMLLAAIDARTTWLPTPLLRFGWFAMALAIAAGLVVDEAHRAQMSISIAGSVLIAGGGYLLLWLVTGGRAIAFGDVRLMPLVGAVAGTMGWPGLYWSLLLGSVAGAVVGVVRMVLGLRGPFPYAPALVSGPYAAALLLSVTR